MTPVAEDRGAKHQARADELEKASLYTDISDMVVQVIEHELNGRFEGEGWRSWVEGVKAQGQ